MAFYRLYFISRRDGHFVRSEAFEAQDDQDAVAIAEDRRGANPLELWCGQRKLTRLDALRA